MSIKTLKLAALALAAVASLATQARAQVLFSSEGDFLIGFKQTGAANNLIVNLGKVDGFLANGQTFGTANNYTYTGATGAYASGSTITLSQLSAADLNSGFTDWSNGVQANPLQWGGIGINADAGAAYGLPQRTIFYTQARTGANGEDPSIPYNRFTNSTLNETSTDIYNLYGAANAVAAAGTNSSAFISAGGVNSFSSLDAEGTTFHLPYSVTTASTGNGPTDIYLDLYASIVTTTSAGGFSNAAGGTAPTYLGSFHLSDAGVLTYTAVPEPSTYALLLLGGAALFFLRNRMKKTALASK